MRPALLLFLLLSSIGCSAVAEPKPDLKPGIYAKTLSQGKLTRKYTVQIPQGYDAKKPTPVVILLHGWTSNGEQISMATGFDKLADREHFVLVSPDGTPGIGAALGWNTGFLDLGTFGIDDADFVDHILDQMERDVNVDKRRVFVAGHSNGAMLAYLVGAKLSGRIAAIAPVAGTIGIGNKLIPTPAQPVSAFIIHGNADETVAYEETSKSFLVGKSAKASAEFWSKADGASAQTSSTESGNAVLDWKGRDGTEVKFLTIDKGHHMWPFSLKPSLAEQIWTFFKAHPKP